MNETSSTAIVERVVPPTATCLVPAAWVATFLGVNIQTLDRWRREGSGPPWYRIGQKNVRYRPAEVEAWAQSQVRSSTAADILPGDFTRRKK